ncbi:MAG: SixA phosphatase family protein [Croceibacterium sp.]
MKVLGLLRHAKSDLDDLSLRDFDRGLNRRGQRGAAAIGNHIRDLGLDWDLIIASPAERVRATLAASGLDGAPEFDERLYLADAATLLALLRKGAREERRILVVGHNPGLQELIFRLLSSEQDDDLVAAAGEKFPTATLAVLELAIDDWADISAGCGRLTHFARPRDLDPELGPER